MSEVNSELGRGVDCLGFGQVPVLDREFLDQHLETALLPVVAYFEPVYNCHNPSVHLFHLVTLNVVP
jgi:hypothetical protein